MQNFTLRDPQGNIILAAESVTAPVSLESYGVALAEADKAVESAFDETEKYSNAMAVMSSEGFGEQAKAVASKVLEKIKEFFAKIADWFAKLGETISRLLATPKFAAAAGPKGKELFKLQGEISKQQSALYTQICKEVDAQVQKNEHEFGGVYSKLQSWARLGMNFSKEVFVACKAYSRGISIISKLTDKSKLGAVESFADKALAIVNKISQNYFLYDATYQKIVANPDVIDEYYPKNVDAINDGIGQLKQLENDITTVLRALDEEEKKIKSTPSNPAPEPTKPAA